MSKKLTANQILGEIGENAVKGRFLPLAFSSTALAAGGRHRRHRRRDGQGAAAGADDRGSGEGKGGRRLLIGDRRRVRLSASPPGPRAARDPRHQTRADYASIARSLDVDRSDAASKGFVVTPLFLPGNTPQLDCMRAVLAPDLAKRTITACHTLEHDETTAERRRTWSIYTTMFSSALPRPGDRAHGARMTGDRLFSTTGRSMFPYPRPSWMSSRRTSARCWTSCSAQPTNLLGGAL